MAVMYGENDKTVPGNALTVAPGSPFGGLKFYGNNVRRRATCFGSCKDVPQPNHGTLLTVISVPDAL
jgi:hypothetical protein